MTAAFIVKTLHFCQAHEFVYHGSIQIGCTGFASIYGVTLHWKAFNQRCCLLCFFFVSITNSLNKDPGMQVNSRYMSREPNLEYNRACCNIFECLVPRIHFPSCAYVAACSGIHHEKAIPCSMWLTRLVAPLLVTVGASGECHRLLKWRSSVICVWIPIERVNRSGHFCVECLATDIVIEPTLNTKCSNPY